jgi:hypothetical protein
VIWSSLLWGALILADTSMPPAARPVHRGQELLKAIRARGARVVLSELVASGEWNTQLLPGVRSADPVWLRAARAIHDSTDAGTSADINDALAVALLKSPGAVLPVVRDLWWGSSEEVCVFGWDSELPGGVEAYIAQLEESLKRNRSHSVRDLRRECLSGLGKTKQAVVGQRTK